MVKRRREPLFLLNFVFYLLLVLLLSSSNIKIQALSMFAIVFAKTEWENTKRKRKNCKIGLETVTLKSVQECRSIS